MTPQTQSRDGTTLYVETFHSKEAEKAHILLVHGANEHIGRYSHVIDALNASGYTVTGVDLRGHGRSYGKRGHVMSWGDYRDDLSAGAKVAGSPVFVLAHSMGGLVAADTLIDPQFEVRGLVLSNPLFGLAFTPPVIKATAAKIISKIIPALSMGNEVVVEHLSRDEAVQNAYRTDPLITSSLTPRWFTEMLGAISRLERDGGKITCPTLLLQGTGDKVTSVEATSAIVDKFGSKDKTTKSYDGLYHEILNEPERELVIADMIAWLDSKI